MSEETIKVVYVPIKNPLGADSFYFHEMVVYTNSANEIFIAEGGPTPDTGRTSADIAGAQSAVAINSLTGAGVSSPFGVITATAGPKSPLQWDCAEI